MRLTQTVIAVAILVVLSFIAYDLHRVATELEPARQVASGLLSLGAAAPETHAQRVERLRRESDEADEYWKSVAEAQRIKRPSRQQSPR